MLPIYAAADGDQFEGHDSGDGQIRLLASKPTTIGKARFRAFASLGVVMPRTQWREYVRDHHEIPILDQGQTGSCVGHGTATGLMFARAYAGMTFNLLSACYVYGLINGGRDGGANPSDAMDAILKTGACLASEVPEGQIYSKNFPASAAATAARFKALDCYSLANFDEVGTAAQLGFAVVHTIRVGRGFNNLDSKGCPPVSRGTGNHCIFAGIGMRLVNGVWVIDNRNSWGIDWGNEGEFGMTEEHITQQGGYDAFAIRAAASDPTDPTNPPAVQ